MAPQLMPQTEPPARAAIAAGKARPVGLHLLEPVLAEIELLSRYQQIPPDDGLHMAVSLTHRLMLAVADLQRAGWSRAEIVQRLESARAAHAESPFIKRLQDWPRGYPGDFETIEYLVRQRNQAPAGRLAFWLEQYALSSAVAQQHRNKVELQARIVLDTVFTPLPSSRVPRVLVLAAGGSPDLRQVQGVLATRPFHAVLLDQDRDALAFSAEQLPLVADRLTLVRRNVVRGLSEVRALGPFDLILAGGLFDYLPARVATLLLRQARTQLLAPGGSLFFTNIAEPNLCRTWMEHVADWLLIHRTPDELRHLCLGAGFDETQVAIGRERTDLTLVVTCTAAPGVPAPGRFHVSEIAWPPGHSSTGTGTHGPQTPPS